MNHGSHQSGEILKTFSNQGKTGGFQPKIGNFFSKSFLTKMSWWKQKKIRGKSWQIREFHGIKKETWIELYYMTSFCAVQGYVVRIAGGNDKQGFPMKQGILTTNRVRLLLGKGHSCYRPRRSGERRRKSVRGCIVDASLSVLNLVIIKKGMTSLE